MKPRRIILLSFLISMALSLWVTWPLGKVFHEGMPSTYRPEPGGPRYMIAGDHLQFLYQLWMLADAFRGQTPFFSQLYEFNQGDDRARREVGTTYFPFGLLYAAGDFLGGRAVGWNMMIFVTAWLTYLASWLLARRFCSSHLAAAVAALPGLLLPYFWACFLGGSPTGPGMMWVPVIFLGIDLAVRDRRIWGGIMAGVSLYMSAWADLHVFFFAFLVTPIWAAWCLLFHTDTQEESRRWSWKQRVVPLSPVLLCMALAYIQSCLLKRTFSQTLESKVRTLVESTDWQGWFAWDPDNRSKQIYIGLVMVVILLLGLALLAADALRSKPRKPVRLMMFSLLLVAIGGIALLAVGPNVPFDDQHLVWRAVRKLLPPYRMIRQPAKVFCVLAAFLTVGLAIAVDRLTAMTRRRVWAVGLPLACAAAILWDYGRRIEPTICLLDYEQGAYRAIVEDAARVGRDNRAMSIPIWPGDSHWNSLTEYYSTLYRTKMLNGYRPGIRRQYFTEVFERLEPMNMGYITDEHLDNLLSKKIGYLLLQEDAFPDKVSPFPVTHTLCSLLDHPRIEFMTRDRETWAFKILVSGQARTCPRPQTGAADTRLPSRRWKAKDFASGTATVFKDGQAGDDVVRLSGADDRVQLPPRLLYHFEGLRYMVAARGPGLLKGTFKFNPAGEPVSVAVPAGPEWAWHEIPVPAFKGAKGVVLTLTASGGPVDVNAATFMGGAWKWLDPGESFTLPAAAFFRAGYSDLRSGAVHFASDRVSAGEMLYAPALPVRSGDYRVTLDCISPAPAGTDLGELSVSWAGHDEGVKTMLCAGQPAVVECRQSSPRPLSLVLRYNRNADLTILSVTLARVGEQVK